MSRYAFDENDRMYRQTIKNILTEPPCHGLPKEPTELLPYMFLGNQGHAEDYRILQRYKITHVLNCAGFKGRRKDPKLVNPFEELGLKYLEIKAEDTENYDITKHFPEAFEFLDNVKKENGRALVHCAMGINRSVAICVGYLMITRNMRLLETLKLLKKQRRLLLVNRGFQKQLLSFAHRHNLLEEMEDARLKQARVTTGRRSNSLSRAFNDPDQVYDPGCYVVKTICIPKEASRSQYEDILHHYTPSYDSSYGSYNHGPSMYRSRYQPDNQYVSLQRSTRARSVHPDMQTSGRSSLYSSVIGSTKTPSFTVRSGQGYAYPRSFVDYTPSTPARPSYTPSTAARPSRSLYTTNTPRGTRASSVGPSLSRDSKSNLSSRKSTFSFDDEKFKLNDKPSNLYSSKSKSAFNLDDIENKYRRYKGVPIIPSRSSRGVRNLIEPDSPLMRGAKNYRSASVQRF